MEKKREKVRLLFKTQMIMIDPIDRHDTAKIGNMMTNEELGQEEVN